MKTSLSPLKPTPMLSYCVIQITSIIINLTPASCFRKRLQLRNVSHVYIFRHSSMEAKGSPGFRHLHHFQHHPLQLQHHGLHLHPYCLQKHKHQPQHKLFPGRDGQLEPLEHVKVSIVFLIWGWHGGQDQSMSHNKLKPLSTIKLHAIVVMIFYAQFSQQEPAGHQIKSNSINSQIKVKSKFEFL